MNKSSIHEKWMIYFHKKNMKVPENKKHAHTCPYAHVCFLFISSNSEFEENEPIYFENSMVQFLDFFVSLNLL